ncbi:hypothetical protein WH96_20945, partial [Kiloniella spongiae]
MMAVSEAHLAVVQGTRMDRSMGEDRRQVVEHHKAAEQLQAALHLEVVQGQELREVGRLLVRAGPRLRKMERRIKRRRCLIPTMI